MGCAQICGGFVLLLGIAVIAGGFIAGEFITKLVDVGLKDAQKNNVYICDDYSMLDDGYKNFRNNGFFTDIGTDDFTPAYSHFFLYHVVNPYEYLTGSVGKIAEIGPFTMFTFSQGFEMEVNDNVLSYKSAYAHVFMDGDEVPVTGTTKESLGVEAPTGTFANGSPDGINRQTPIANFNTGYLGALGNAGTEIALLLGVKCTQDQIANIVALKPTCSDKQIAKKDPNCACCLPDDLVGALNYGGLMNEKVICDTLKDQLDAGAIDTFVKTLNGLNNVTFASMDDAQQMTARVNTFIAAGAVADADAYHAMDNHTKALFTGKMGFIDQSNLLAKQGTMYGTCAALQAVNIAYCSVDLTGRPTDGTDLTQAELRTIFRNNLAVACGGACVWPKDNTNADPTVWDTTAWDAATDTEKDEAIRVFSRYNAVNVPTVTATGSQVLADTAFGGDGSTELPLATRIAVISGAGETDVDSDGIFVPQNVFDVGAILSGYATFSDTTVTSSEWAGMTEDEQEDLLNSVYFNAFNVGLAAIGGVPATGYQDYTSADDLEGVVEGYAASLDTFYCKCADGSDDHKTTGCCLSSGAGGGTDFTGFGCLYGLPGWFETNIANDDMEATMQRSKVIQGLKDATKQDYCPLVDASKLGEFVQYEGATSFVISSTYSETVQGGNAKFMEPQGLTTEAGDITLSLPGTKAGDELKLFVSQVSRSLELGYSGSTELVDNLVTSEFRPDKKLLWSTPESGDADAEKKLEGKTSALHPLSWEGTANVAPLNNGLPVYLSQVNFLNADPDLLDSNSNGIELYHCFNYPESVAYPNTDAQSSQQNGVVITTADANGNYPVVDTTKCDPVTTEWLTANKNDVDVWLQVEPASGFTIAGHQRLMGSIAPTVDCDPAAYINDPVYAACLLGFSATGDLGTCHKPAKLILESMDVGGVQAGVMLEGAIVASGKTYDPGFPCSSANLFTPGFKGGGLVPVFWLDKASELASNGRQGLVDLGKFISIAGLINTAAIAAGVALVVIGALCVAKGGGNKVAANA